MRRGRTAGLLLLAAATAVTGVAPAAAAPDERHGAVAGHLEAATTTEVLPGARVMELGRATPSRVRLTDRSVYVQLPQRGSPDLAAVWATRLHDDSGRLAAGTPQRLGVAWTVPFGPVVGVDTSGDEAAWVDRTTGALITRSDRGEVTRDDAESYLPHDAWAGDWRTSVDILWPVPLSRGGGANLLALSPGDGLPWGPTGGTSQVAAARVSGTTVAWLVVHTRNGPSGDSVQVLHAARLGPDGILGEVVELDRGTWPSLGVSDELGGFDVSDELLAWSRHDGSVRWVRTDDLEADPTLVTNIRGVLDVAVSDTHVGVALDGVSNDGSVRVMSADDPADVLLDVTATGAFNYLDLTEELLAFVHDADPWSAPRSTVHVVSLDPERPVSTIPRFADVSADNPLIPEIDRAALAGLTTGYPDGTFRPHGAVTRQATAAFLHRSAGSPAFEPPARSPFADVAPGDPFYREITWAASAGLTTGTPQATGRPLFRPQATTSRQAMAAFLHRSAGSPAVDAGGQGAFADVPAGHPFSAEISWLASTGVTTGTTQPGGRVVFEPSKRLSRQAAVAFLVRFGDLD